MPSQAIIRRISAELDVYRFDGVVDHTPLIIVSSRMHQLSNCYNHRSLWPINRIEQPSWLYDHHRSDAPMKKQSFERLFQQVSNDVK